MIHPVDTSSTLMRQDRLLAKVTRIVARRVRGRLLKSALLALALYARERLSVAMAATHAAWQVLQDLNPKP